MKHTAHPEEVLEIVEYVASALLNMSPLPASGPAQIDRHDEMWTARVGISGAFNGFVAISCARSFARTAAQTMTSAETSVADEDARDALAELANVIGGNVKALLSTAEQPCRLSLPRIGSEALAPNEHVLFATWTQLGARDTDRLGVLVAEIDDTEQGGSACES